VVELGYFGYDPAHANFGVAGLLLRVTPGSVGVAQGFWPSGVEHGQAGLGNMWRDYRIIECIVLMVNTGAMETGCWPLVVGCCVFCWGNNQTGINTESYCHKL